LRGKGGLSFPKATEKGKKKKKERGGVVGGKRRQGRRLNKRKRGKTNRLLADFPQEEKKERKGEPNDQ